MVSTLIRVAPLSADGLEYHREGGLWWSDRREPGAFQSTSQSLWVAALHCENDPDTFDIRTGVLCIILCFALGIANIFTLNGWHIVFAVLCL